MTISLDEPAHASGSKEIKADLENLMLSEGVRNMSPNLLGMNAFVDVEYEYVSPRVTELLVSVVHVMIVDTSIPNPPLTATLPSFLQTAIPNPTQMSLSVPTLKVNSE